MESNEDFYKSMSDAEWNEAEAIETEIGNLLREGFTKDTGLKFVRTVMEVRKAIPEATVGGVFDMALKAGLSYLEDKRTLERMRSGQFTWGTDGLKPERKHNSATGKRRGKLTGAGL